MTPRITSCWPGYTHNNWVCQRLLDAGLNPDVHFPARDGRAPEWLMWRYYDAAGNRFEHRTDYGRLGETDVATMIGRAKARGAA